MNLSDEDLRTFRLNEFLFKDQGKFSSTASSSGSVSHSGSIKKNQRKKLFTEERLTELEELSHKEIDMKQLQENLSLLQEI